MSTIPTGGSASYLYSILNQALQGAGAKASNTLNNPLSSSAASATQPADSNQLSPFAQLINTLQQLQQSDPAKYAQVTGQIATNLQSAAQSALSSGNTGLSTQLSQLSSDFSTASKTGQLPNIQDLAQAVGGGHHHHHGHAAASDSDSDSQSAAAASPNNATNPLSIILNTVSSAGISS
jgi:hypothetical protein